MSSKQTISSPRILERTELCHNRKSLRKDYVIKHFRLGSNFSIYHPPSPSTILAMFKGLRQLYNPNKATPNTRCQVCSLISSTTPHSSLSDQHRNVSNSAITLMNVPTQDHTDHVRPSPSNSQWEEDQSEIRQASKSQTNSKSLLVE